MERKTQIVNSSKIELKHTNLNNEIVLKTKLNNVQLFFEKLLILSSKKESSTLFSQEFAKIDYKTRIYNFHITYLNGMNKISL